MIYLYLNKVDGGGVIKIHLNLARALLSYEQIQLITNCAGDSNHNDLSFIQSRYHLNTNWKILRLLNIWKIVRQDDLPIFFVGNGQEAVISILLKLIKPRIRIFYVQHVDVVLPEGNRLKNWIRSKIFAWTARSVDRLVVVSHSLKDSLIRLYPGLSPKIEVIYNPVLQPEDLSTSERYAIPEEFSGDELKLLSVGRLSFQKGYDFLLQVALQLNEKLDQPFKIYILGDGELQTELSKQVKLLNLENNVVFLGFKKEPRAYMRHCDVFLLHSRWEGLPTVLIEALACSSKIIAYDCPHGVKEILGSRAGVAVVDEYKPPVYAQALADLIVGHAVISNRDSLHNFMMSAAADKYRAIFEDLKNENTLSSI